MKRNLLQTIQSGRILVSDGAWGTLLHLRGLEAGECPEMWNLTHRDDVYAIAKGYIDAGSDIILTNSFGANPTKLSHFGLEDKTVELNEAAASISRQAAGNDRFVLGSMGPTGVMLMMGTASEEDLFEGFKQQAMALAKGGADGLCIETMSALDEAVIAIQAAKAACNLPIACTFTFEKTAGGAFRTMMGVSPGEMLEAVKSAGASIIGSNCGNGFKQMIEIVRELRTMDRATPILIHANAGKPVFRDGETVFPETPDDMAGRVTELVNSGANIVGGCCGTTPAHIQAMVRKIRG